MRRLVFFLLAAGVLAAACAHPSNDEGRSTDDNEVDTTEAEPFDDVLPTQELDDQDGVPGDSGGVKYDEYASEEPGDDSDVDDDADNDSVDNSSQFVTPKNAFTENTTATSDSKVLQTGNKRPKNQKSGISKKQASQLLPLLMIPLMIQMQLIPMMLLKLKMMAVKALMLGKAALVIILLNVLRNSLLGADSMEEQYEQHSLASSHYGYSGMPEVGAWINQRRVYHEHSNGPSNRGHEFVASPSYSGRSLLNNVYSRDQQRT